MSESLTRLSILLAVIVLFGDVKAVTEGTPCYTSRGEYGICLAIKQCAPFIDLLLSRSDDPEVRNYLVSSQCGYDEGVLTVCCPQTVARKSEVTDDPVDENNKVTPPMEQPITGNAFLSPPDCGFSPGKLFRLVGGQPAKLNQFPWMVALGYKNKNNPKLPKWLCGGSLITKRHILTAAHCVHKRPDLYLGRVGELDLYNNTDGAFPEDIPIISKKIHENYSPVQYTSDIALLTLEREPINDKVWPICLPHTMELRAKDYVNLRPIIAGWGALYFDGPTSSILQYADVPVVNRDRCQEKFGTKAVIDDRIICAGWTTGKKDTCQGDSGGPLMYGESKTDIRFFQIGIVSYGFRCAEPGYPGVYTNVVVFLDWIQRNLV